MSGDIINNGKRTLPEGFFDSQISQKPKNDDALDEEWAKFQQEMSINVGSSTTVIEAAPVMGEKQQDAGQEKTDQADESDHEEEDKLIEEFVIQKQLYSRVEKLKHKLHSQENTTLIPTIDKDLKGETIDHKGKQLKLVDSDSENEQSLEYENENENKKENENSDEDEDGIWRKKL